MHNITVLQWYVVKLLLYKGHPYKVTLVLFVMCVQEVARERYGVPASQVRVYVHYQPTYYHLHVHFTHVFYESALGTTPERAHLLEDVIDNIERDANYYSKCKLSFGAKEHELLTAEYRSKKPEYFQ